MKNTKTFRCSLNRTILSKSKSHGQFLSSREVAIGLFGFTDTMLAGCGTNQGLGDYDFYIRQDYYGSDSPKVYSLHAEKAGSELRITRLSDVFKDLGVTETDELVLERVEEDGQVIYLIDKASKNTVLIIEQYEADNYNTFVYDQIELAEKKIKGKSVDSIMSTVTDSVTTDAGETRYVIDEGGKRKLESLRISAFNELPKYDDIEKMKDLEEAYSKLRQVLANQGGLVLTDTDDSGETIYTISQEVRDLLYFFSEYSYDTREDGGVLSLNNPYWVWDNSYNIEVWEDFIDKRVPGYFKTNDGEEKKVIFIIRKIGKAEITCANTFEDKTIYSISVFDGESELQINSEVYRLERKGEQLIVTPKAKKVSSIEFYSSI